MNKPFIIKIQFGKNIPLGNWASISKILLDLLQYNPDVYPRDYDNKQGYIYIFENDEHHAMIYRMLNTLVGIDTFEYETVM